MGVKRRRGRWPLQLREERKPGQGEASRMLRRDPRRPPPTLPPAAQFSTQEPERCFPTLGEGRELKCPRQ